jgi:hypothetical protein
MRIDPGSAHGDPDGGTNLGKQSHGDPDPEEGSQDDQHFG